MTTDFSAPAAATAPAPAAPGPTRAPSAAGRRRAEAREAMRELLAERIPGQSLDAPLYTDPDMFPHDIEGIFGRHWFFAATVAEIPEPGDYVTIDVGRFSLIVMHGDDEEISVLHNVCRHRGARVLQDARGSTGNLVCPYHSWTYASDGRLLHAAGGGPDFDPGCLGLRRAHCQVVSGLIFVCLAQEPPEDFDAVMEMVEPYFAPHEVTSTKVAVRQDLVENGNWKLTMENNRECYHCDGHPELACSLFPTFGMTEEQVPEHHRDDWVRMLSAQGRLEERCERYGLPYRLIEEVASREAGVRIERIAMDGEGESFSASGHRLSQKLLGDLPDFRLGDLTLHLQPNCWFHFLSDHIVTFAVFPIDVDRTLVRTTWLVADDAVEGKDYYPDSLAHVWRETNLQDAAFVEMTHRGVSDPAYVPGRYMPSEHLVDGFLTWWTARMQEHLG